MTRIHSRCTECGGFVTFSTEDQLPYGRGLLGFCWCGEVYRLDCGDLVRITGPEREVVIDLREARLGPRVVPEETEHPS